MKTPIQLASDIRTALNRNEHEVSCVAFQPVHTLPLTTCSAHMRLNADQHRAVHHKGNALVSACPGSGKTFVLALRAERLLRESADNRVVAISFTRDAANEMRRRIEARVSDLDPSRVVVGTFHSIMMQMQNASREKRLRVLDAGESRLILERAWDDTGRMDPLDVIQKALNAFKATGLPLGPAAGSVAAAVNRYEELLVGDGACDFADLVRNAVVGMQNGIIKPLSCTHMLVDEFQDVDAMQLAWVIAHVYHGVIVTVVGDDDQAIFAFRHSLGKRAFDEFIEIADAEQITLGQTYRCPSSIMSAADRLIQCNSDRVGKRIKTANEHAGVLRRADFSDQSEEALAAGTFLHQRPMGTAAILARTASVLNTAELMLASHGIPYIRRAKGSMWDDGLPKLVKGLLGTFAGHNAKGLQFMMHALRMDTTLISTMCSITEDMPWPAEFLIRSDSWLSGLSHEALSDWRRFSPSISTITALIARGEVCGAVEAMTTLALSANKSKKNMALAIAASKVIRNIQGTIVDKFRRLEWRERPQSEKNPSGMTEEEREAVRIPIELNTFHGSKGMEYEFVWMMAVTKGILPHKDSAYPYAEERRLAYVGATRAKHHLTMSTAVEDGAPSQFFEEMELDNENVRLKPYVP